MTANGIKPQIHGTPGPTPLTEAADTELGFGSPVPENQTPVRDASRRPQAPPSPSSSSAPPTVPSSAPNPEVIGSRTRRRYSIAYKRRIVDEADRCEPGQLGALLRREGLYSSTLQDFRRQVGRLDPEMKAQRASDSAARKAENLAQQTNLLQLEKENRRLKTQLRHAQTIIDFQKKLSEVLGIPLEIDDDEERESEPIPQSSTPRSSTVRRSVAL